MKFRRKETVPQGLYDSAVYAASLWGNGFRQKSDECRALKARIKELENELAASGRTALKTIRKLEKQLELKGV